MTGFRSLLLAGVCAAACAPAVLVAPQARADNIQHVLLISSVPVPLPSVPGCNPLPDQAAAGPSNAWTDSFQNIQCYDGLKVQAVVNEANGLTHDGKRRAPTLLSEIQFADAAIGRMVDALRDRGLLDSTLIFVSAKHGQSPIDSVRYLGIANKPNDPVTTSPATILAALLPFSESPANPTGIGPTEDDISLVWLADSQQTANAVAMLESQSPATANVAGIGQVFSGSGIGQMFNLPGLPPTGDPRTPDIIAALNVGVTYSGSGKKLVEHGGFSHDDTNVMMLLSNPRFTARTVTSPVETAQIAPTILVALGLDPKALQSVRQEHTQVLPNVPPASD